MNFTANKIVAQKLNQPRKRNQPNKVFRFKPPKRHSNFFLTLNTQKNINSLEPEE